MFYDSVAEQVKIALRLFVEFNETHEYRNEFTTFFNNSFGNNAWYVFCEVQLHAINILLGVSVVKYYCM